MNKKYQNGFVGRLSVCCLTVFCATVMAEPLICTGEMIPQLQGKPVHSIRIVTHTGNAIPFQIDELDSSGDYVCDKGTDPNRGNGILDRGDEIVFMLDDADSIDTPTFTTDNSLAVRIAISRDKDKRYIWAVCNEHIGLSPVSYITYNHATEKLVTPWYYATFGHDRFHFTSAGVMDFATNTFVDLTRELRIKIFCRTLFGLLPISYTEENMICLVKRYKTGPIRLIRRGDFHLNLGLFVKGSRAAVNQICYPQMVRVPVYVHLPVRLRTWFSEAYIEMTPVLRDVAKGYSFDVPDKGISRKLSNAEKIDTLIPVNPNRTCMYVRNAEVGYGWLLDAAMDESYSNGSGFLVRQPSDRNSFAQCGFRLTVRDLPKGYYLIGNWVVFSQAGEGTLPDACKQISQGATISVEGNRTSYYNQLNRIQSFRKK